MAIALFLGRRSPSRPPPLAARFAAVGLDRDRRPRTWLGMPSTGRKEPPRQWIAASLMVTKQSRPETLALDGVPAIRERPPPRKVFCSVLIRSLRPYVRPVDALALERWPRWFPRQGFQTTLRPSKEAIGSIGVSRVVDRLITPSAHYLASSGIGPAWLQFSCSPCLANLYAATADFAL
jgi:hypothetical protein